jgi:hypothetical protein
LLPGIERPSQWFDLSFLDKTSPNSANLKNFGLYKSRFSLVVCGSNDEQWTAYAFGDRDLEENPLDEDDFPYQKGQHEDPISSDSGFESIDANKPIRDARTYWLVIFEARIAQVLKQWDVLVSILDDKINSYVCYIF